MPALSVRPRRCAASFSARTNEPVGRRIYEKRSLRLIQPQGETNDDAKVFG